MSAKRPKTIDAFFVRKSSAVGGAGARQKCADSASVVANAAKGGDGDGDSAQPEKQQQQQQQAKLPAALTGSPGTGAAVADGKVEPTGFAGHWAAGEGDGTGGSGTAGSGAQEGGRVRKRRASSDGAVAEQGAPGKGSPATRPSPRKRGPGAAVAAAAVVAAGSLGSGAAGQAAVLGVVQQGQQEQGQGAGLEAPGAAVGAGTGPDTAAGQGAAAGGAGAAAGSGGSDGAECADDGLTPLQRAKIQANRNRALVRRAIAEAAAAGAEAGAGSGSAPPALSLSTLLVEPTWRDSLGAELQKPYIKKLESFLHGEWAPGRKPVFPPKECVFAAFNACPFDKVRVVILGQDPYHGPGQAMGLSFSVPAPHRPLPPSLLNMYKEARQDLGWTDTPKHGDLTSWSVQGVLLLNTCLTVRQGEANSHSKRGWEDLTDEAIRALSRRRSGVVFMLWGKPAEAKAKLIDGSRHHALVAAHPSPLSASRGFFGCRHFSRANALLEAQGLAPIDWWPAA